MNFSLKCDNLNYIFFFFWEETILITCLCIWTLLSSHYKHVVDMIHDLKNSSVSVSYRRSLWLVLWPGSMHLWFTTDKCLAYLIRTLNSSKKSHFPHNKKITFFFVHNYKRFGTGTAPRFWIERDQSINLKYIKIIYIKN